MAVLLISGHMGVLQWQTQKLIQNLKDTLPFLFNSVPFRDTKWICLLLDSFLKCVCVCGFVYTSVNSLAVTVSDCETQVQIAF